MMSLEYQEAELRLADLVMPAETEMRLDPQRGVKELAAALKDQSLINAIVVKALPDGKYEVKAGRRRVRAFMELGRETIRAMILRPGMSQERDVVLISIAENIDRENLTPLEEAKGLKTATDAGWTEAELAARFGRKKEWVQGRLALLNLAEKPQRMVHEGKLGPTVASIVARAPKQFQGDLASEIVDYEYDIKEAQRHVNFRIQQFKEEEEFSQVLRETEFKKCPTCGGDPSPARTTRISPRTGKTTARYASCSKHSYHSDHIWNLKTGKTQRQEEDADSPNRTVDPSAPEGSLLPKKTRQLVYAFRYGPPLKIIRQSLLNLACERAIKALKQGARHEVSVTVDGFHIQVGSPYGSSQEFLHCDLPEPWEEMSFESHTYRDGSLTKVTGASKWSYKRQSAVDEKNAKVRRLLNSLPEIVAWQKEHEKQKQLPKAGKKK